MLTVPVWVGMPAAATLAVLVGELVLAKVAVGVGEAVEDGLALSCGVAEMQWPTGSEKELDVVMPARQMPIAAPRPPQDHPPPRPQTEPCM